MTLLPFYLDKNVTVCEVNEMEHFQMGNDPPVLAVAFRAVEE
jgi:hypothetical protein